MKIPENKILLSFILPVFNVEKYLPDCLDSILKQITAECELVLVDDGSTDSSRDICYRYSKEYNGITVVEQKNSGAAAARNTGLLNAQGTYVTFVDSDDRIAANSIKNILSWIKTDGCDICFMRINKLYPDGVLEDMGECISREKIRDRSKEEVLAYLASRPKFSGAAWGKIYRREFLGDNNLIFPEDGLTGEDLVFVRDVFLYAESFDFLDFPYYEYRQSRAGSVTSVINYRSFKALARFIEDSSNKLTRKHISIDSVAKAAMGFVAYEYTIMLWQYSFLGEEKKLGHNWLRKYVWVLEYAQNEKSKAVYRCINFLGIRGTARLLDVYMKGSKMIRGR